jgi:hypothetical protein
LPSIEQENNHHSVVRHSPWLMILELIVSNQREAKPVVACPSNFSPKAVLSSSVPDSSNANFFYQLQIPQVIHVSVSSLLSIDELDYMPWPSPV